MNELELKPIRWELLPPREYPRGYFGGIYVEQLKTREGEITYRVTTSSAMEMNKKGKFSLSSLPSSRSDRNWEAHRWDDFESVKDAAIKAAKRILKKLEKEETIHG